MTQLRHSKLSSTHLLKRFFLDNQTTNDKKNVDNTIKIFLVEPTTITITSTTNRRSTPRLMNNNNSGGGGENGGLTQCVAVYDCIGNPQQNKLQFRIYDLVEDDAQKSYEIFPRGVCYILNTVQRTGGQIYEKAREVQ